MQHRIIVEESKVGSRRVVKIIEDNSCGGILPYSCYFDGNEIVGYYNSEDYNKLRDVSCISGQDAIRVLESIIRALDDLRDYLIFPEGIVVSPDTIFIRNDYERAGLIIIAYNNSPREEKCIEMMTIYLKTKTTAIGGEYLDKALKFMYSNPKYQRLVAYLDGLKNDLAYLETK